jgi:hypothetical protein
MQWHPLGCSLGAPPANEHERAVKKRPPSVINARDVPHAHAENQMILSANDFVKTPWLRFGCSLEFPALELMFGKKFHSSKTIA